MGFFCGDPYGDRAAPPFMPPPDAAHMLHGEAGAQNEIKRNILDVTMANGGPLANGISDFEAESAAAAGYQPLPSMFSPELKPMAGW